MYYVLFEVTIKQGRTDDYLTLAANLRSELEQNKGFIRSERFTSIANEGKLLSLSVWESEEAISEWRNVMQHRLGQRQGRDEIIESYTITVASKIRCYTMDDREEAPEDSNRYFGVGK